MCKVSIITSTFNKANYLKYTLAGYCNQTFRDFEIVIVNDGSSDRTCDIVESYQDRLNIQYYNQLNSGISVARNKALDMAKGEILIIVDDDRIPGANFIEEHLKKIKADNIVSIGHKVRIVTQYNTELTINYQKYIDWLEKQLVHGKNTKSFISEEAIINDFYATIQSLFSFDEHYNPREILKEFGDELIGFEYGWTRSTGGNMAFHRKNMGGIRYDTAYNGYGFEDLDLTYQLHLQGYRFIYNWESVNYHQEHPRNKNERENNQKNQEQFYRKYERNIDINLFETSFERAANLEEVDKERSIIQANQILKFYNSQRENQMLVEMIKSQLFNGRKERSKDLVEVIQ